MLEYEERATKHDDLETSHVSQSARHTLYVRRVDAVCVLFAVLDEHIPVGVFAVIVGRPFKFCSLNEHIRKLVK